MRSKRPQLIGVCGLFLFTACGPSSGGAPGSAPNITYAMDRLTTGSTTNTLVLNYPEDTGYEIRLSGDGLTSDAAFGEYLPMQRRIELSYSGEGEHSVQLEVFQQNRTPYLTDTLTWTFSTEVPDAPIVSFSELATSDANVSMLIAGNRAADANEIWVEGDLAGTHAAGGYWDALPDSNIYLLQVTPEDGMKAMTVKLRNIYGNESAVVAAEILKKSQGPTACTAAMSGSGSNSRTIQLELAATDVGQLYYNVFGDVEDVEDFKPFSSGDIVPVTISAGSGAKTITVQIRDEANNYCDDIAHTLTLSGEYLEQTLAIDGDPIWTDGTTADLTLTYDHLPSQEPIEMKVTGGVMGADVNTWIPFAAHKTVTLMPGSGYRKIFVQFRDNTLTETFLMMAKVFKGPSITLVDAGAPFYDVIIDKITGMTSATITGCMETYNAVPWQAAFTCQPTGANVVVLYNFSDGTSVSKSASP